MSQENVELVHRVLDAFNRRDLRWWRTILDASPDRTVEVVEVRDLGELTLSRARVRGQGGVSEIPYDETVWSVVRWRDKKAVWWGVFPTKAEALEAIQ